MRKILGTAGAMAVAAGVLSAGAAFGTPSPVAGDYVEAGHKVTICHRTGSATNPYVVITVDVAAIDGDKKNDHSHHGPVGNGHVGDVIPPVGSLPGVNWDDNWDVGDEVTAALCVAGDDDEGGNPT